jgi:glutamyl-tRNA synthetase
MSTDATPSRPVVTRFAPSPTGRLHIGGARTALFNWALARGAGGLFLLRVEDTDQARSSDASTRQILDSLAWLGIDWDEGPEFQADGRSLGGDARGVGPFHQSERLHLYRAACDRLLESGRAYHAFETSEELDAKRKEAMAAKRQYRYDRAALDIPEAERARRAASGEPHVVRFRMPDEPVVVRDVIRGEVTLQPEDLEDFVIVKADGFPTYHFAVVVDDEGMGVTHVVRGQEHLSNTPKHVALQAALGYSTPTYAHLPLIFNQDGSKMSKRDKDKVAREACKAKGVQTPPLGAVGEADFQAWIADSKSQLPLDALEDLARSLEVDLPEIDVTDFREAGYLPEVVCNYIALLGWSPGDDVEKFDQAFLCERLSLERIGKTNAKFDRNKLLAFNNDAITEMSAETFAARWRRWCERHMPEIPDRVTGDAFVTLAEAVRPRSKTLRDAGRAASFVLTPTDAIHYDEGAVTKWLEKNDGEGYAVLETMRDRLDALESFDQASIHACIEAFAQEKELGMGKVAQPLRVAMTGSAVSPPIDATLAVLGKDVVIARIRRLLASRI